MAEKKEIVSNSNEAISKYYEIDTQSDYIRSIRFICRDGRILYIPYALQPIIAYNPEKGIMIQTMQKDILLVGERLKILADWLGAQKVTWVKESPTGKEVEMDDIFLSQIIISDPA